MEKMLFDLNMKGGTSQVTQHIKVTGDLKTPPNLRKLARALLSLAQRQMEEGLDAPAGTDDVSRNERPGQSKGGEPTGDAA